MGYSERHCSRKMPARHGRTAILKGSPTDASGAGVGAGKEAALSLVPAPAAPGASKPTGMVVRASHSQRQERATNTAYRFSRAHTTALIAR